MGVTPQKTVITVEFDCQLRILLSTTVNINGESFHLKERRRTGLMEPKTPLPKEENPKDNDSQN